MPYSTRQTPPQPATPRRGGATTAAYHQPSPPPVQSPPRYASKAGGPTHLPTGPNERVVVSGFLSLERTHLERYYYETYLGHGGYGSVWTVVRARDGKVFAVKIMEISDANGSGETAAKEVACLEQVDHFACVALVETHWHAPHLFIITEYCDGGSLHFQLHRSRFMIRRTIGYLAFQLIAALQYLHKQRKLLHRDIKPENVFLYTSGLLKIGDFGLSHVYETLTDDAGGKTICGTAEYFAPELCQGRTYGHAADMWSLGVLLYECATGHRPFKADSAEALYKSIINDPVEPIEQVPPAVCHSPSPPPPASYLHGTAAIQASQGYYYYGGPSQPTGLAGSLSPPQQTRCGSPSVISSCSISLGCGTSASMSSSAQQVASCCQSAELDERVIQLIYRLLEKDPKRRPTSTELLLTPYMQELRRSFPDLLRKGGRGAEMEQTIRKVEEDLDDQLLSCTATSSVAASVSHSCTSWSIQQQALHSPSRRTSVETCGGAYYTTNNNNNNSRSFANFHRSEGSLASAAGGDGDVLRRSANTNHNNSSFFEGGGVSPVLFRSSSSKQKMTQLSFEGPVQRLRSFSEEPKPPATPVTAPQPPPFQPPAPVRCELSAATTRHSSRSCFCSCGGAGCDGACLSSTAPPLRFQAAATGAPLTAVAGAPPSPQRTPELATSRSDLTTASRSDLATPGMRTGFSRMAGGSGKGAATLDETNPPPLQHLLTNVSSSSSTGGGGFGRPFVPDCFLRLRGDQLIFERRTSDASTAEGPFRSPPATGHSGSLRHEVDEDNTKRMLGRSPPPLLAAARSPQLLEDEQHEVVQSLDTGTSPPSTGWADSASSSFARPHTQRQQAPQLSVCVTCESAAFSAGRQSYPPLSPQSVSGYVCCTCGCMTATAGRIKGGREAAEGEQDDTLTTSSCSSTATTLCSSGASSFSMRSGAPHPKTAASLTMGRLCSPPSRRRR